MNVLEYEITLKQRPVHICLQRNWFIACLMILYWLIICRLTSIERYLNYIHYEKTPKRCGHPLSPIALVCSLVLYLFSTWTDTWYDHEYVPLVISSFMTITLFVTRPTRRVPLVEQELHALPVQMSSPPVLVWFLLLDF